MAHMSEHLEAAAEELSAAQRHRARAFVNATGDLGDAKRAIGALDCAVGSALAAINHLLAELMRGARS